MKRIIGFIIVLSFVLLVLPATAFSEGAEGLAFDSTVIQQSKVPEMPLTWEARIIVAKNAGSGRLGTIIGNFSNSSTPSMNLEIRDNGAVALYWNNGSYGPRYDFTQYDIRKGVPVSIAVTVDLSSKTASLYIDGVFIQSVSTAITAITLPYGLVVGGDLRENNSQYLKNSTLLSAALYSDVRTADEITADLNGPDIEDAALIAAYDFTSEHYMSDLSGNHNDLMKDGAIDYDSKTDPDPRGMYFTDDELYKTVDTIDVMPKTIEAWIKIPKGYNDRAGVVIGNFEGSRAALSFEIYTRGNPRLYLRSADGKVNDQIFTCDVRTGDWAHLTIVNDTDNGKVYCYLDGELKQTVSKSMISDVPDVPYCLGGDLRSGNVQYFKGKISSISLFSDVRSAEQISTDMNEVDLSDGSLIAHYELDGKQGAGRIANKAGDDHAVKVDRSWIDPADKEPLKDYAYSMAILGDIQVVTYYFPDQLPCIFDWLTENAEKTNLKYVFGLGDTTNFDTMNEWTLAKAQFDRLNGVVPYSVVRGNHDSSASFNRYFGTTAYKSTYDYSYDGKIENTARFLTVGKVNYLIFTLDYGASDSVLNWAGDIIDENPGCSVIVTTHAYLFRDGTTLDQNDVYPPATTGGSNNGDQIWEKFASKHKNISLVISGHDPCDDVMITQTEGDQGNVVTQMLVDPQSMDLVSPKGMICMLYFSEDGRDVQVEYYSAVLDRYFKEKNQTEFTLSVSTGLNGDINGDGALNAKDYVQLKRYILGTYELDEDALSRSDINGDGTINAKDYLMLKRLIIGTWSPKA